MWSSGDGAKRYGTAGMDPAGMNRMGGEERVSVWEDLPLCQGCEMGRLQEI